MRSARVQGKHLWVPAPSSPTDVQVTVRLTPRVRRLKGRPAPAPQQCLRHNPTHAVDASLFPSIGEAGS